MKLRLGGWQRLGIVLTVLWFIAVAGYASYELRSGPFSPSLVTETVVTKTGEPVAVLSNNPFRDLVPVETHLLVGRFALILAAPFLAWLLIGVTARTFKWVATGFRVGGT